MYSTIEQCDLPAGSYLIILHSHSRVCNSTVGWKEKISWGSGSFHKISQGIRGMFLQGVVTMVCTCVHSFLLFYSHRTLESFNRYIHTCLYHTYLYTIHTCMYHTYLYIIHICMYYIYMYTIQICILYIYVYMLYTGYAHLNAPCACIVHVYEICIIRICKLNKMCIVNTQVKWIWCVVHVVFYYVFILVITYMHTNSFIEHEWVLYDFVRVY